jgi:hypothetical protein
MDSKRTSLSAKEQHYPDDDSDYQSADDIDHVSRNGKRKRPLSVS